MVKVLLVFEDFNEVVSTESYLKKIGFDVVGLTNEVLMNDQILSFNPDVVVAHGRSQRVSSLSVGQKIKDNQRFQGKVVIVVPKNARPTAQDVLRIKMDGMLEAPVHPEKLIQTVCRVVHQDATGYLEKLQKAKLTDPELQKTMKIAPGAPALTPEAPSEALDGKQNQQTQKVAPTPALMSPAGVAIRDPERIKKYSQYVSESSIDMKQSSHQRKDLRDRFKEMKKDWDSGELENQDELRRQFVDALFKKKA